MPSAPPPAPQARVCALCGRPKGCFAFTLVPRVGKPTRNYYHPPCFVRAKRRALAEEPRRD